MRPWLTRPLFWRIGTNFPWRMHWFWVRPCPAKRNYGRRINISRECRVFDFFENKFPVAAGDAAG